MKNFVVIAVVALCAALAFAGERVAGKTVAAPALPAGVKPAVGQPVCGSAASCAMDAKPSFSKKKLKNRKIVKPDLTGK